MKFTDIKVGMKLKLVKQIDSDGHKQYCDYGYKIGDVVRVTNVGKTQADIIRLRDNEGDNYCIPTHQVYTMCWEPVNSTMRELVE